MGNGYVFNEEALFASTRQEKESMRHTETLVTSEESAFLRVDLATFTCMAESVSPDCRGASPHLMEDKDLLWELFERHYFVKSTLRLEQSLIEKMPTLRAADWEKRATLNLRRRNSPSKRPI